MLSRGRLILGGLAAVTIASSAFAGESDPQEFTQIERGRYLAILSDCASCHTVPGSNQPFAGGRAIETPFGNIVAPNITPDPETGIGSWSDEAFDDAVRGGIRRNGSRLYPAMPYNAYTKMSRSDVLAIRAYLNTITPVRNAVEANTLPFPFNIRASLRVWNALYFKAGRIPDRSAAVGGMEPRRFSGRWSRSLWSLPYAEDIPWRRQDRSIFAGSLASGLVGAGHHQRCEGRGRVMVASGSGRVSEIRTQPRHRRDWTDGRSRDALHHVHDGSRPQGYRDLSQVLAWQGRRPRRASEGRPDDDRGFGDLSRPMLRLPWHRRQGRSGAVPVHRRFLDG